MQVFGSGNQAAHMKHLATHDDEAMHPCECQDCVREEEGRGRKRKAPPSRQEIKKKRSGGLQGAVTKSFQETAEAEENNVDNPDDITEEDEGIAEVHDEFVDEEQSPETGQFSVNCGVCGNSFKDIDKLEEHIGSAHGKEAPRQSAFVARVGGWECRLCGSVLRTSRELKSHKARRECRVLREEAAEPAVTVAAPATTANPSAAATAPAAATSGSSCGPAVRSSTTALWQQSESRNWAAEFGYSKAGDREGEGGQEGGREAAGRKATPGDILSAMKMTFGGGEDVEDEEEDEEDSSYLYGSKRQEARREEQGEPRVLSQASRQTRSTGSQ